LDSGVCRMRYPMKYPLPLFLLDRWGVDIYRKWLLVKAKSLHLNESDFIALYKSVVDYGAAAI
jgi:hypothetical protein